jgi:hypothetical protein
MQRRGTTKRLRVRVPKIWEGVTLREVAFYRVRQPQ